MGCVERRKVTSCSGSEEKRTAIRFALMAAIKEHEEKLNTERTLTRIATTLPIGGFGCAFEFSDL
jgi:hypothetical protein